MNSLREHDRLDGAELSGELERREAADHVGARAYPDAGEDARQQRERAYHPRVHRGISCTRTRPSWWATSWGTSTARSSTPRTTGCGDSEPSISIAARRPLSRAPVPPSKASS